uniref:Serine protease n=1 Tax=Alexandrium monilatum TaxID=311494 RepID=A0A7S4SXG7_9DINO
MTRGQTPPPVRQWPFACCYPLPAACLASLVLAGRACCAGANRGPTPVSEAGAARTPPASELLQATEAEAEPSYAQLTNELRSSIVRIEKIEQGVNWFEPYMDAPQMGSVGTGFAAELVTEKGRVPPHSGRDPVFITNAHVVRNAHAVKVQFAAGGQERFDAIVPVIYEDHDLAVVKLRDPGPFLEYLQHLNLTLRALAVRDHDEVMGQTVAAVGFPLGSTTLKLSTGVIAGTESLEGKTVFQCTAPISPGNSGGPLLALGDVVGGAAKELQVVGVNFAATEAAGAELVNYVIPAVHVRQILSGFAELGAERAQQKEGQQPEVPSLGALMAREAQGQRQERTHHVSLRMAPVGALPVHTSPALYAFGGCKEGVFISRVAERSALHAAKPPVEAGSFVMDVDGVSIDGFGMGRKASRFLGDPVPFESFMQVRESLRDPVELTACRNGTVTKHTVSMMSQPSFEPGIRMVMEPHFEPEALDFEVFADVTVMQMTKNHVAQLLQAGAPVTYGRWLLEDNALQPRLLVTNVGGGSYASTVLAPGTVLASLNGRGVSSLAEFREHFEPADGFWRLSTERGADFVVGFAEAFAEQVAGIQQGRAYLLTPAVTRVAQRLGMVQSSDEQASTMKLASLLSSMLKKAYEQGQASAQGSPAPLAEGGGGGNRTDGAQPRRVLLSDGPASFLERRVAAGAPGPQPRLRREQLPAPVLDAAAPPAGGRGAGLPKYRRAPLM